MKLALEKQITKKSFFMRKNAKQGQKVEIYAPYAYDAVIAIVKASKKPIY